MKITQQEVIHVAHLARLDVDESATGKFAHQLATILEYVDQLNQLDTEGVIPTSHAIELTNAFRDDTPREHLDRDMALANAPEKEDGNFVVPRIID